MEGAQETDRAHVPFERAQVVRHAVQREQPRHRQQAPENGQRRNRHSQFHERVHGGDLVG